MSIRRTIAGRLDTYQRVLVWGAGNMGRNAVRRWLPLDKVVAVVDSNPDKLGEWLCGIPIKSPTAIAEVQPECIVICTHAAAEVQGILDRENLRVPSFFIHELFLPVSGHESMSAMSCLSVDLAASRYATWPLLLLHKPQILVNCSFRWVQAAASCRLLYPLYPLLYIFHYLACAAFSIQLPHNAKVGPGLIFAHYGAIVFSARAKIGAFFTIYHGCTVGTDESGAAPVIGDFVTQFSGSHVLGRCQIGNKVRIGANAVVLALHAPDSATVVGVPARVLQKNSDRSVHAAN